MSAKPKIGAYVLESLTTGMYTEPLDAAREYVQNALDAIQNAEAERVLKDQEGKIEIELSADTRAFRIRDNGTGIPAADVEARLLNIGMSSKQIGKNAGFRGIGRLAGIAYCEELIFRTSSKGEVDGTEIRIDCKGLKSALSPRNKEVEELAEVLTRFAAISTFSEKRDCHYFEVRLNGIQEADSAFLNRTLLENYLCQAAPVPYDCTRFTFAPKIIKFLKDNAIQMPQCHLVIREGANARQVLKPYKRSYKAGSSSGQQDVSVQDIKLFIDEAEQSPRYWGWYALAPLFGAIQDDDVAGLRLRHHNISLGNADRIGDIFASLSNSAQYRRFNRYYIGEIHVLSEDVIPNGRRDGFEENSVWRHIRVEIAKLANDLKKAAYDESSERSKSPEVVLARVLGTIDKVSSSIERGLASKDEQAELLNKVTEEQKRIERIAQFDNAKKHKEQIEERAEELGKLRKKLESDTHFVGRKLPPSLNKTEKMAIEKALRVLHRTMSTHGCTKWKECYHEMHQSLMDDLRAGEEK